MRSAAQPCDAATSSTTGLLAEARPGLHTAKQQHVSGGPCCWFAVCCQHQCVLLAASRRCFDSVVGWCLRPVVSSCTVGPSSLTAVSCLDCSNSTAAQVWLRTTEIVWCPGQRLLCGCGSANSQRRFSAVIGPCQRVAAGTVPALCIGIL